jgi:hypothetical protein
LLLGPRALGLFPARGVGRLQRFLDLPDREVVEVQRIAVPGVQRVEVHHLLGDAVEGLVHPFGSGDGHRVDDMNALFAAEAKYFLINNP